MSLSPVAAFLDAIHKSDLIDEPTQRAFLEKLQRNGPLPADPEKIAVVLIQEGLLTRFQCEKLLAGRSSGFYLGNYKVLDLLGSGGMGSVYLAEHRRMKRRVALKILPSAMADDAACVDRFYREAKAVAAVDHPNIIRAHDVLHEGNVHCLVMEYVDGIILHDLVKRHGPLNPGRAAHYVRQAAEGLQHILDIGLIHRDIKPSNILVDRAGVVKLLDLGLARFFRDDTDNLTRIHDEGMLGTVDFMAPEQALDSHAVDIRADIYSLGATFYFLVTGKAPFENATLTQKLVAHQTREPTPVRQLRPEVPEGIAAVMAKMMGKDPGRRYQLPREVADELEQWTRKVSPALTPKELPIQAAGPSSTSAGATPAPGLSKIAEKMKRYTIVDGPSSTEEILTADAAKVVHQSMQPGKFLWRVMPRWAKLIALIVLITGLSAWIFLGQPRREAATAILEKKPLATGNGEATPADGANQAASRQKFIRTEPALVVHCGRANDDPKALLELKNTGYDCRLVEGVNWNIGTVADPKARRNCWYSQTEIKVDVIVPPGTAGRLRLQIVDVNSTSRKQEMTVQGKSIGTFERFEGTGKTIDIQISEAETHEGRIAIRARNLAPLPLSAVISTIEFYPSVDASK